MVITMSMFHVDNDSVLTIIDVTGTAYNSKGYRSYQNKVMDIGLLSNFL